MKVTHASIIPAESADLNNRPKFTPELLAASGARYSRNNSGIEEIYSNIDFSNLDKSVDGIFKMVDYGHQSIADMAPVAMFMDDVSIYLAYHLWSMCAVVGGQESSTRYIKISIDGIVDPDTLGIPENIQETWKQNTLDAFAKYQQAVDFWDGLGKADPKIMRISDKILEDTSEKGKKVVDRMRRNYVFDRARYFLPMGAATNVMMVMPAREWVKLINDLLSSSLNEFNTLGNLIRDELTLVTPRLVKHAIATDSTKNVLDDEFECLRMNIDDVLSSCVYEQEPYSIAPLANLEINCPNSSFLQLHQDVATGLRHRTNRYSRFGSALRRMMVRFSWNAVAMAEIRDLNRHRTGEKYCPLIPLGFYAALDQIPKDVDNAEMIKLAEWGFERTKDARENLRNGIRTYMYDTFLGSQFPFEHLTTANHFIYEAELRTGLGAHYRYAKHLRDVLQIWYKHYPETQGNQIFEGTAEPE
jgi:thymidylate synthase ThyX